MNRRAVLLGLASTAMTPFPIVRSIPDVQTSTLDVEYAVTGMDKAGFVIEERLKAILAAFQLDPTEITMSDKVAAYFEKAARGL